MTDKEKFFVELVGGPCDGFKALISSDTKQFLVEYSVSGEWVVEYKNIKSQDFLIQSYEVFEDGKARPVRPKNETI